MTGRKTIHPIRALLIYVLVVFIGGALVAPWLFKLAVALAPHSDIVHKPFHRWVDRSLLGLAVIGLWPLLRSLGATSWREVGLVNPLGQWKSLLNGFTLGFVSLAIAACLVLAGHGRQLNPHLSASELAKGLLGAAGTAAVVSVIEELLFRGGIFGGLRRFWDWRAALLLSSMVYAIVHFLQKAEIPGPVEWYTGLKLLPLMLRGFVDLHAVVPGFFNLTFVGILLGLAYQRTGTLYYSIGLHAGWIFWLKAYGLLTATIPGNTGGWFWGSEKLIDGWLVLGILAVCLGILNLQLRHKLHPLPA